MDQRETLAAWLLVLFSLSSQLSAWVSGASRGARPHLHSTSYVPTLEPSPNSLLHLDVVTRQGLEERMTLIVYRGL